MSFGQLLLYKSYLTGLENHIRYAHEFSNNF